MSRRRQPNHGQKKTQAAGSSISRCLAVIALSVAICGCTSPGQRRQTEMRERSEVDKLKTEVARLREQVRGISTAQQDVYSSSEKARRGSGEKYRRLEERLSRIERDLKALDAKREADRREIIESLSRKISSIMAQQQRTSVRVGDEGYEHVVRPGETLSEIAGAYNVTVGVIVRANGLKNANAIRAGQKLFIPE